MDGSQASLAPPAPLTTANLHNSSRSSSRLRRAETCDSDKAGRSWARDVEDPWDACILTLDGGGIRGYSSLVILKALMHEICLWEEKLEKEDMEQSLRRSSRRDSGANAREGRTRSGRAGSPTTVGDETMVSSAMTQKAFVEHELLPCHYFDFMYGTSTGGLIATMLGRLRMTVDDCLEVYRNVGHDLFGRRKSSIPLATKYYHEPLERAVQDIVGSHCYEHDNCDGKEDMHPIPSEVDPATGQMSFDVNSPRICQSCCLTATHDRNLSEAYLLRTYPHYYSETAPNWITRYNEGAEELKIWEVTRATSAAPFYFKMLEVEIEGQYKSFKDGGIRENNPSGAALSEFHSLYEGCSENPALLLSVGTGRPDHSQDGFAAAWPGPFGNIPFIRTALEKRAVLQNLLIKYTEGEKQHAQMREHARGEHTWYKRLNVTDGLQNMPLDSWVNGEWQGKKDVPGGASLTRMETVTAAYLAREFDAKIDTYAPPSTMLRQAAEKLVRQRRARELEGGERWDTFVGKHLHKRRGSSGLGVGDGHGTVAS
ncbi:hypothetical protein MBLNU13_g05508t1 [Cladosporium sp. NU13]